MRNKELLICTVIAAVTFSVSSPHVAMPQIQTAGWDLVIYATISIAISLAASYLLAPDDSSPLQDDKPTNLAKRGAFVTWLCGRRLIGPVFAFADGRFTRSEKVPGGGKGFGDDPEQDVYYETGWHQLIVGTGFKCLHSIRQRGATVFRGPITSDSHPSGTVVDLGKEGKFEIYWGEKDQPVSAFLTSAGRLNVASRFPLLCHVVWIEKRLGTSPLWQKLDYEMEQRPTNTVLSNTPAYMQPSTTLDGSTAAVTGVTSGGEGVGFITLGGTEITPPAADGSPPFQSVDFSTDAPPKSQLRLTGNAASDQDLTVFRTVVRVIDDGFIGNRHWYHNETDVYPIGGLPAGADATGTLQAYSMEADDGINPAHIISELLFASWPNGLGLDPTAANPEPWDIDALEALGTLAVAENLPMSTVATGGENAQAIMGALMQDLGMFMPLDTASGKTTFRTIRPPSGALPNISLGMLANKLPRVERNHAELTNDRMVYTFKNRVRNFATDTIAISEDGEATFLQHQSAQEVLVPNVIDFATCSRVAERRQQEDLANSTKIPVFANRGARELLPGDAITVVGFNPVLRVFAVKIKLSSSVVELTCLPDFYGTIATGYQNQEGGQGGPTIIPVAVDVQNRLLEVPAYRLNGSPDQVIVVPRVRANAQVSGAVVFLSDDNITYTIQGTETVAVAGGTLDDPIAVTDAWNTDTGPEFTALGPDIARVLDQLAEEADWRRGRQLVAVNQELFYLRRVVLVSGSTYRLDGLIRARLDTVRQAHAAGDELFIFLDDELTGFGDPLLVPGGPLFLKAQPTSASGQVPLANVLPVDIGTQRGKGVTPMNTGALRVTAPVAMVPVWHTGDAVAVAWSYRSILTPGTGAGMQAAGRATGQSDMDGSVVVSVTTLADVVVLTRTFSAAEKSTTFTNLELTAALGSETSFKVRVKNVKGGFSSDEDELTVTFA